MAGTMKQDNSGFGQVNGKGKMPPSAKDARTPILGGPVAKIVPEAEHDAFLAFAKQKPRLLAMVVKGTLTGNEETNVKMAYAEFKDGEKSTALVKHVAATTAVALKIPVEEAEAHLAVLSETEITAIAVAAAQWGTEPKCAVRIGALVREDGSYVTHMDETKTVSITHARLQNLIKEAFELAKADTEQTTYAGTLPEWRKIQNIKDEGERKAAEKQWIAATEKKLMGAKAATKSQDAGELAEEVVFEIFQLLNYDTHDIDKFVDGFESDFSVDAQTRTRQDVVDAVEDTVMRFVKDQGHSVVLNQRSTLYDRARKVQLEEIGCPLPGMQREMEQQ